jgi:hypothetical protein
MKGFDVVTMKSRKAAPIEPWTARTFALSSRGRLLPKDATAAPNSDRISTHSTIDPSWFPHTPEIL